MGIWCYFEWNTCVLSREQSRTVNGYRRWWGIEVREESAEMSGTSGGRMHWGPVKDSYPVSLCLRVTHPNFLTHTCRNAHIHIQEYTHMRKHTYLH